MKRNGGPLPHPPRGPQGLRCHLGGTDTGILFQGRQWGLWKIPAQMRPVARLPHTGTTGHERSRGNALRARLKAHCRSALAETHLISGAYTVGFTTEPTPIPPPANFFNTQFFCLQMMGRKVCIYILINNLKYLTNLVFSTCGPLHRSVKSP